MSDRADRQKAVEMLASSSLFPPEGKGLLVQAIRANLMSQPEVQELLEVLSTEKQQLKEIDQHEATAIARIKERYAITN